MSQKFYEVKEFKEFIKNLISSTRLDSKYVNILTDDESIKLYKKAFTHSSYNSRDNYEVFEQLGDITLNKFLVWYFHKRFPMLNNTFGIKIVARLRIKYGSKQFLSELADKYNFWNNIFITEVISNGKRMSVLEDVFESFIGVTEFIVDSRIYNGLGYICCYNILKGIFDKLYIDISYESLFDSKTRLKELFDFYKEKLGTLMFDYSKENELNSYVVKIYRNHNGKKILLTEEKSTISKSDAEQKASEKSLHILTTEGFYKNIPDEYKNILIKLT